MNARTASPAVGDAPATPGRPPLTRLLTRWRGRLKTWRRPHRVMLMTGAHALAHGGAMTAATQAFATWAAQHEGSAVELSLSSHCLLMLADGDVSEAADAQALRTRAIERWTHYLDLPAEGFDTEWWVRTSLDQGRSPVRVACAVSRALCASLLDVARRHGVRLLAVQPWWATGLRQAWEDLPSPLAGEQAGGADMGQVPRRWAWREGAWQTQAEVQIQTQAATEPGRWVLRSLAFVTADQADPAAVPGEVFDAPVSPVASSMPSPTASPMVVPAMASTLALQPTGRRQRGIDWAESLNFAGPRVRVSFWSWALLVLGAVAVVHALELAGQVDEAQQAAQAELSRLRTHAQSHGQSHAPTDGQAHGQTSGPDVSMATPQGLPGAMAPLNTAAAKTTATEARVPTLQPDAWRSAAQLAAWLGHPWATALDHVDATAHRRGISLMRFQLDLGTWGVRAGQPLAWRLQAAVPDDATALAWLDDLGPQAELQRRDALAQPVPSEHGTLAWRIDVSGAGGQP